MMWSLLELESKTFTTASCHICIVHTFFDHRLLHMATAMTMGRSSFVAMGLCKY